MRRWSASATTLLTNAPKNTATRSAAKTTTKRLENGKRIIARPSENGKRIITTRSATRNVTRDVTTITMTITICTATTIRSAKHTMTWDTWNAGTSANLITTGTTIMATAMAMGTTTTATTAITTATVKTKTRTTTATTITKRQDSLRRGLRAALFC